MIIMITITIIKVIILIITALCKLLIIDFGY